jgi:uncharacterized membrane protein
MGQVAPKHLQSLLKIHPRYHASSICPSISFPDMNKENQIDIIRWTAAASLFGLIVLGVAWEMYLAPVRPGGSLLALKVLPLILPLAGVMKNRMYTYRWLSLLVWLYFTEGAVRAWSDKPPSNYLAMVEVALCLVLFAACSLHVKIRFKGIPKLPKGSY